MKQTAPGKRALDRGHVLSKAVMRAARSLGLSQRELAETLGLSEASVSRLGRGSRALEPDSKEAELALLLLRVYRSLDALVGGSESRLRDWFHAPNHHLGGVPAERVLHVAGLVQVADYLDAMRGKS